MESEQGERDAKWRSAEIAAALVHLYYMGDNSFDPSYMPRNVLAKLFGVPRTNLWRAMNDAKASVALAEEVRKRLQPYYDKRKKQAVITARKRKAAIARANEKKRQRRLASKRQAQRA